VAVLLEISFPTLSLLRSSYAYFMGLRDPETVSAGTPSGNGRDLGTPLTKRSVHERKYQAKRYEEQQTTNRRPQQYCITAIH